MKLQLSMKKISFWGIFICLVTVIISSIGYSASKTTTTTTKSNSNGLVAGMKNLETLPFDPQVSEYAIVAEQPVVFSLVKGRISVFLKKDDTWREASNFGPTDNNFTTFRVVDINNDNLPEVIAGTANPGFIYTYVYKDNDWVLQDSQKYIWSTVSNIMVGHFDNMTTNHLLVQNDAGNLFLFKKGNESIDLIWKSPNTFKLVKDSLVVDLDNDKKEEIVVVYKTGGISVLKMEHNSISSVWDNFLWGKTLGLTAGDWDNDKKIELIFTSSQKIIYFLGLGQEGYDFEAQQVNPFIAEQIVYKNGQLLLSDTAGNFHFMELNSQTKKWQDKLTYRTGRVSKIILTPKPEDSIIIWGLTKNNLQLDLYDASLIKYLEKSFLNKTEFVLNPGAIYHKDQLYLSPKALMAFEKLKINYSSDKLAYHVVCNNIKLDVAKKGLKITLDGSAITDKKMTPLITKNEFYLPLEAYQSLLKMELIFDSTMRAIYIK